MSSSTVKSTTAFQNTHAFDVDPQAGFMVPTEPLSRLPHEWEDWEMILDTAVESKLQLGDSPEITEREKASSEAWRACVCKLPVLPTTGLESSPILLRRAHVVLAYLMHFYIQSLPPDANVVIPRSISLPLLRVSTRLDIPPILTFSDTVLYNWVHRTLPESPLPTIYNLRTKTMFTGLIDEEEFYLCSARIELRGVEALTLMRATLDEVAIGDVTAVRRISGYLSTMANVINELKVLLMEVRKECNPEIYYNQVRPWFRGEDSDIGGRKWVFEGLEEDPSLQVPTELSGPSAGQSSMVHALDVFLGVNHQPVSPDSKPSLMLRMQRYMPRNHQLFLNHLRTSPRPLRAFVMASNDAELHSAFNKTVTALKEFRDAHMIIATLYILGPARKAAKAAKEKQETDPSGDHEPLKGTGGTDLVKFLKGTRSRTTETLIP